MNTNNIEVHRVTPLVRADHDPGAEWPEFVREERIALAAEERHTSRVRAAEFALALLVLDPDQPEGQRILSLSPEEVELARAIAAVEVHGIGGRRGYSGGKTDRMRWASSLGKGRHNARDGAAWDAAIAAAFGRVHGGEPTPRAVLTAASTVLGGSDMPHVIAFSSARAVASHSPEEARAWLAVREGAELWRRWGEDDPALGVAAFELEGINALVAPLLAEAAAWPPTAEPAPMVEIVSRRAEEVADA